MDVFEKILSEIDKGIKTIKPLMRGETRQIAESQIIGLEEARKIIEKYKDDTGWIPASERLPEEYGSYLVAWKTIPMIDRTHTHFYEILEFDPDDEALWTGIIRQANGLEYEIIAWMPLPEPYMQSDHETKNQTNADRIRSMTDEELADFLMDISMGMLFDKKIMNVKSWLQSEVEE